MSKINVQNLLDELFEYSNVEDSTISFEAKQINGYIQREFVRLKTSNEPFKQRRMIELFMGGTIAALQHDDAKYRSTYSPAKLYPRVLIAPAADKMFKKDMTLLEKIYTLGRLALQNLPAAFFGAIFQKQVNLIGTRQPQAFFPRLCEHADKVDLLVHFCKTQTENLEVEEFEYEDFAIPRYKLPDDFVQTFIKKHEDSYKSGCFGGFFNRTNLKPSYDKLTADQILQHAKAPAFFFGGKNRTCRILQELNIIDENKEVIVKTC